MKISRTSAPNPFAVLCTCLAYVHVYNPGPQDFVEPTLSWPRTRPDCAGNPTDLTLASCFFSHRAQAPGHDDYDCNHIHSPQLPLAASLPIPQLSSRKELTGPFPKQNDLHTTHWGPIRRQISPSALPPSQALDPYAHACTTVTGGRPR